MREFLDNQFGNLFLWVPFIMAAGAAVYFTMPNTVNLFTPTLLAIGLLALAFVRRIPIPIRAFIIFAFGFCYAATFTDLVATPQLGRDMHNATVTGHVTKIDYTPDKARVFIKINASDINAGTGHALIRVSVNTDEPIPEIGDRISATVGLFRPSPPDAPGAFDYARWLYFNKISATGYMSDFQTLEPSEYGGINALRDYMHGRMQSFLGDSLILGYKNAVPEHDAQIWTATGIGHVWSISGFHMTLVSGWLFAIFYLIFRSIPAVVRRIPAKMPAMICASVGLGFYLFLSGTDTATIRAFLMTCLVFAAFIFGRTAISLRNVCVAFCIIFMLNPHHVMQAGFQLSFAAIFGLVWLWCDVRPRMPHSKPGRIVYGTILTSIIATLFTAPFVAMHFGAIPIYSIIGNLILLPVFSVAIMPLVIVGTIGALFHWHGCLTMAHSIYDITLGAAKWIADLPFATLPVPYISNLAICVMILGLMCVVFIRPVRIKINYILGTIFITMGIVIILITPRPVFYATHDHELVGFVEDNGKLTFNKSRASNHHFAFDTWKQLNGESPDTPNRRRKHARGLYMYETQNFRVAYMQKFVPLQQNIAQLCRDDTVTYIVSYFDIDAPHCNPKILRGAFVIYESGRVSHVPHSRRWHNRH